MNYSDKENCPATGGHFFHQTKIIFKLSLHIIRTRNLSTRHVLTRKTSPPLFHEDWTIHMIIFKLGKDIIRTKLYHKKSVTDRQTHRRTKRKPYIGNAVHAPPTYIMLT
ncbi:hypothetical protein DPMN_185970 [Dreissena polymorpha]|uniref:Uncharacterized protein n=1 Tax=Dreissena polymorpha TaxID=45954 RepID=A0A9D4DPM0_DREPO|nr:hypothetical protein DPMN_185970 [Dreissena polymorpha]